MTEIRRLLLNPAVFGMLTAAALISLFFTVRNEHAKWETAATVMDTDAAALRTEYIRQMEALEKLELKEADELLRGESETAQAVSHDYTCVDYVREVYVNPKLQACTAYPDFLGKIRENADNYQKISLFSKENSFVLRNIRKTDADYQRVSGVQPKLDIYDALEDHLSDPVPDVLILILCICSSYRECDYLSAGILHRNLDKLH